MSEKLKPSVVRLINCSKIAVDWDVCVCMYYLTQLASDMLQNHPIALNEVVITSGQKSTQVWTAARH